jgi:RecQ family ATP-dependent DNA helicase
MGLLRYMSEFQILVCTLCQYALDPAHITTHLRGKEHRLSTDECLQLMAEFEGQPLIQPKPDQLILPDSSCKPLEDLPIFRDGLACQECSSYICRSQKWMEDHYRKTHGWKKSKKYGANNQPWRETWCKRFFKSKGLRYFAVASTNQSCSQPATKLGALLKQVEHQLDEKQKIIQEKKQIIMESNNPTEVSSWLERTQWIRHLEGQERAKIAVTADLPTTEEPILQEISSSIEQLIQIARQTILQKKVSSFTLHRINSFQPNIDKERPLNVKLGERTLENYIRVWKRLLCYVLRTADTEPLYKLTVKQHCCMDELVQVAEVAKVLTADRVTDEVMELHAMELQEKCLQFCIALLDHRLDHDEYESAIISYLAIAGLQQVHGQDRNQYKFIDAINYTPILSGFIKIAQMLVVQWCFEAEEKQEVNSCRQLLDELHSQFMTTGTATPIDWALRLRLYGRGIRDKTTAEGKIDWVDDTVIYGEIELSMPVFREFIHKLCEEARMLLLNELLFLKGQEGELPVFNWSELRDNPAKDEPDWYFIRDTRNQLVDGRKWLVHRVLQVPGLRQQFLHDQGRAVWKTGRVNDYLDSVSLFLEKLLVLMHMTGGQPARALELLSLRYCNTLQGGHRNIFIENGLMTFVTLYHKGYSITGSEKIIHRYLPQEVGELLLYYIWLVLPFRQQLQQLAFGNEEIPSAFLWSADQRKWTPDRVKKVIKRESDRLIGVPLNISSYRHIAIAIANRYMKKATFEPDDQNRDEKDEHDEVIDEQSGHSSATAGTIYARWIQEAPGHVQQKRQKFRQTSHEWHMILEFSMALARCKRRAEDEQGPEDDNRFRRIQRWRRLRQTNMQEALRKLMGQETQFRSKQEQAIRAIIDYKSPIIAVMRTGGGKSLLFMLPASVGDAGTTVVVTPLLALKQDMQRRCRQLGINCVEWKGGQRPLQDASIILVTPESAISKAFMNYMRHLQGMDRLDRIVIDECHVLLNTRLSFRKQLQKLQKLIQFTVQMVLLTATLPPSKEGELREMMCLEAPLMIRDLTSRPNIAYNIRICSGTKDERDQMVVELVRQRMEQYTNGEGIIVYGGSVDHCKSLAEKLGCQAYYAAREDKNEVLQDWIDGRTQEIVATNALGLGIDKPNVRLVLHAEPPRDLLDYGQESGRAGRDGLRSEAIIMTGPLPRQQRTTFGSTDERLLHEYMVSRQCRRQKLDQYLDGNLETVKCLAEQEACDNCQQKRKFDALAAEADVAVVAAAALASAAAAAAADAGRAASEGAAAEGEGAAAEGEGAAAEGAVTEGAAAEGAAAEGLVSEEAADWNDEVEYERQRAELRQQQQAYRQTRMDRAQRLQEFEQKLKRLRGRCSYCYYYGLDDEHGFSECGVGQEQYRAFQQAKDRIKYVRYAACFKCGCPQFVCKEYQRARGQGRFCEYPDVVLAGAVVALVDGEAGGGNERICEMAGRSFDVGEQALGWLGEMTGIERQQASNAALVFLEVFSPSGGRR